LTEEEGPSENQETFGEEPSELEGFPPARKRKLSFADRLRDVSSKIEELLTQYDSFKTGDEEKNVPPSIVMVADPDNLLRDKVAELKFKRDLDQSLTDLRPVEPSVEPSEREGIPNPANPVFHALIQMGEFTRADAAYQETLDKVKIVKALGVEPLLEAAVLVDWVSQVSKELTYFLNAQLIYSEEIKAKYPELMTDVKTARGIADKLYIALAEQRGYITLADYHKDVARLLHYTKIIERAAQHLADYHEEFMARGAMPFEWSPGVQWVTEEEEKGAKPLTKPKTEEESEGE